MDTEAEKARGSAAARRWNAVLAALTRASSPPRRAMRARSWLLDGLIAFGLTVSEVGAARRWVQDANPPTTVFPLSFPSLVPTSRPALHIAAAGAPPAHTAVPQAALVFVLLVAALSAAPLLARRRYPLSVFWTVIGAAMLYHVHAGLDPNLPVVCCLVAAYSAAMYSPYRTAAMTSLVVAAGLAAGFSSVPAIPANAVPFLVLGAIGLVATTVHTWKQRVEIGRERISALEAEQDAATRLAVERERARIARELHDVVTHNVSVMVIQAGAARKVMDAEPDQAREALLAVESGGRAAMSELRHVMGLLTMAEGGPGAYVGDGRGSADGDTAPCDEPGFVNLAAGQGADQSADQGADPARRPERAWAARASHPGSPPMPGSPPKPASPTAHGPIPHPDSVPHPSPIPQYDLAPQPGLGQLATLVGRVRDTGVPLDLKVTGTPTELPPGVDLAAYRVVQEALTNAVKHAAGARVRVSVDYAPRKLHVEVSDSGGVAAAPAGSGNGRGLIGLRERLAVYGATLEAGRRPAGGYRVRAVIPLEEP